MDSKENSFIINEFINYIENKNFPCVAAKASLNKTNCNIMVADNIACPKDDCKILKFIYDFVDDYRKSDKAFSSLAIIFKNSQPNTEDMFDTLMWQRLQALSVLDAEQYSYDKRVNNDPDSANFSFSIKEEAFFIIGLHSASSRVARKFKYPTLVFNPHAQFEAMKQTEQYNKIQKIVRKRDLYLSGSINPMLENYGTASEVYQYSGKQYDAQWQCPLNIQHATNNTTP